MNLEEARLAVAQGAFAIGLVGKMPSGPGVIDDKKIREIASSVPPQCETVLLTSEQTAEGVIRHQRQVKTTCLQIVSYLDETHYVEIRAALPKVKIIQVVHVEDESALDLAAKFEPFVDLLLLDSGNTTAAIAELGGTGRTHNWSISRRIVESARVPVFLAGGLTVNNVGAAIEAVRPYGVDVCSGIRTGGALDQRKLADFCQEVNKNA